MRIHRNIGRGSDGSGPGARAVLIMFVAAGLIGMGERDGSTSEPAGPENMAPVTDDIPDVVVSDGEGVAQPNVAIDNEFVFPDALDLDLLASDPDEGPVSTLIWSYTGGGTYHINGVAPLDIGTEDPVAPGAKSIQDQDLDTGNPGQDASPATITVRNANLSPIGGPNADPGPNNAEGIVPSETEVLVFFVSDGDKTGFAEVVVFTQNDGFDRVLIPPDPVDAVDWSGRGSPDPWQFVQRLEALGTVTSSFDGGLCMEATLWGMNDGEWFGPYGATGPGTGIELVDNAVYDCHFNFEVDHSDESSAPLIAVILDNSHPTDAFGASNAYSQETFFLDNFGGRNAPLKPDGTGRETHNVVFAPSAICTPQWRSGAFTPAHDPVNDFRIRFRVFDIDGGGWNAEADLGTVCMRAYDIGRYNLDDMVVLSTEYDADEIKPPHAGSATPEIITAWGYESEIIFEDGNVRVIPVDPEGGYTNEMVTFRPGSSGHGIRPDDITDNYPVMQQEDALFLTTVWISSTEGTPVDLIRHGMDVPTQEVISLTLQTASMGAVGMPSVGEAQAYHAFTHGNSVSASTLPVFDHARPRMDFMCHEDVAFDIGAGVPETTNTAGLILDRMTVQRVSF